MAKKFIANMVIQSPIKQRTMKNLITVPNFTFDQGDPFLGDMPVEYPISVEYYNGSISLTQGDSSINIHPDYLNSLFKEIKKHLPEATKWLERNTK